MADFTRRSLLAASFGTAVAAAAEPTAPNIVFLISDDHSAEDLGCYGNTAIRTPNLDRMAREGMRFANCFVTSPQCSPNRSAILTGQMGHTTGTSRLHTPMPPWQTTFLGGLKVKGYYRGAYRKVHQGPAFEKANFDFLGGDKPFSAFFESRPKDRPFFLHIGFTDPHRPYRKGSIQPPHDPATVRVPAWMPDSREIREDLADYADEISRMDGECGQVFDLLRQHGLERNTLVVFTGDNGMPFPRGKGTCFDAGLRVPLIARWTGRIAPGTVKSELMSHIDMAPTILDAAGAPPLEHAQGRSFLPLLTGGTYAPRAEVFASRNWHNNFDPSRCIRTAKWKLIYNGTPNTPYQPISDLEASPTWASWLSLGKAGRLRPEHATLLEPVRPVWELYDVENDPAELYNVASVAAHRDTMATLKQRLSDWMHDTYDFLPPPFRTRGAQRAGRSQ
jgi:N-sulfoglucosamine sulfohydrolase